MVSAAAYDEDRGVVIFTLRKAKPKPRPDDRPGGLVVGAFGGFRL